MVSEGIFINGEKVTFNPENILNGDVSAYTEAIGEATQDWLDEHLEPGGSVPIDDTLSISGAAADAKVTGDAISELNTHLSEVKSGLTAVSNQFYKATDLSHATGTGKKLAENTGLYSNDANYNVLKFNVIAGSLIRIICDFRWQFQSANNTSASVDYRVDGKTYGVYDGVITVPEGATYVMICTPASDSVANCFLVRPIAEDTDADFSAVDRLGTIDMMRGLAWKQGNLSSGSEADNAKRIRSDYLDVSGLAYLDVAVASGYSFSAQAFDSNKTYINSSFKSISWTTTTARYTVMDEVKYLRFVGKTSPTENNIEIAESVNLTLSGITKLVSSAKEYPIVNIGDYPDTNLGWILGEVNASGRRISSTTRICTALLTVGKGTIFSITSPSGVTYQHRLAYYTLDGEYIGLSDAYVGADIQIASDCCVRILIRKSNNGTIEQEDVATMAAYESIVYRSAMSKIIPMDDPKIYTIPENLTRKAQIEALNIKNNGSSESEAKLLFVTDIHGDKVRTQRVKELVNNWGTGYFDAVINGGDTVTTQLGDYSLQWFYDAMDGLAVPLLNTVGNHDARNTAATDLYPSTTVYNAIIKPFAEDSGYVQPTDAETNGYNYYYKDINSKVRIVVLDFMFWDATQLAWLESVLASAKTASLHVLGVSHGPFTADEQTVIDCLWSKSGMGQDGNITNISAAQAVKDFMDAGGSFIGWVVGHAHRDCVSKLPNYGNQFVVNLNSFSPVASKTFKNPDTTKYNYDCLTYISIDVTSKTLKLLRIGANIDVYGTIYNTVGIDYGRQVLIGTT